MCSGSFAKCLGISLIPLAIVCVLCNILLFFPGGKPVEKEHITEQVWYFGGILGSGVLMLSSILFAAVGVAGAGYSVIVSAVAINEGPQCVVNITETVKFWDTPFTDGDYLSDKDIWSKCLEPSGVVSWHLSLFSVLLVMGLIQMALCAVQVVNGLLACLCGDCCGGVSIT
ncbi:Transmembrane 4 L6 family member 4 [Dissostichus eleginoides]|uniref:Transmembrane 4 L6 family member 4 n=1 Tax=Dissostichus eleginoides TaxID=100907 RepID=A0AAD9CAM2_DISEL|nr:Transmembrane 4 L6 family member 4 [Dissostichus eleginoides]